MFKFMKSKKGFSLVELMIVVVIMAILVAVAVPIYNSVTDNARKGTCIDNQRQIMSVVGNDLMLKGKTATAAFDGTIFTLTFNSTSEKWEYALGTGAATVGYKTTGDIEKLFQTVPSCGDESGIITVKAVAAGKGESYQVVPSCSLAAEKEHVVTEEKEVATTKQ